MCCIIPQFYKIASLFYQEYQEEDWHFFENLIPYASMQNILLFIMSAAVVAVFAKIVKKLAGKSGLIAWIALQAVLSNLFVLKQINLFGLNATASDVFTIGGLLGVNILQQHYGYPAAKQAISSAFLALVFFCFVSQVHLLYVPASYDFAHAAYATLLSPTPRLLAASVISYACSQSLNVFTFKHLSQRLGPSSGLTCHVTSVLLAQTIDTVLFSYLGLYGLMHNLLQVILISSFIKTFALLSTLPFTQFNQPHVVKS
jgi:uncharacterized integral membrane protein (TIGR00697 family)